MTRGCHVSFESVAAPSASYVINKGANRRSLLNTENTEARYRCACMCVSSHKKAHNVFLYIS